MEFTNFSKMNLEQIKALAKFLGFGYYRVSKRKGKFIECDDFAKEIFGIPLEETELLRYSIKDIYFLDQERKMRVQNVMANKCVPQSETISARVKGDYVKLFDICWCYEGKVGEPVTLVGLVKKIESSTISPKMFNTFPRGLYELDDKGRVVRINDMFMKILKHPSEDSLIGAKFTDLCTDPALLDLLEKKIAEKGSGRGIIKMRNYYGEDIDVECFSQNIKEFGRARWGMLTDVTKREQYYRALDNVPTGFYYIENEKVRQCNKHFAKLLGFDSKEEAIGIDTRNFFASKQDVQQFFVDLKLADRDEKPLQNYEIKIRRANDGQLVTLSVDSALVKDDENRPLGRLGTVRDISDIVKLREEVDEAKTRLNKTNKDIHNLVHTFLHPVVKYAGNAELFRNISTILQETIQSRMSTKVKRDSKAKELAQKLLERLIEIRDLIPDTADTLPFTGKKQSLRDTGASRIAMRDLKQNITTMVNVFDYTIDNSQSDILLDEATRDAALWSLKEFGHLDYSGYDIMRYYIDQGFFEFLQSILFNYLLRISTNLIDETEMMKRQVEAISKYIGLKEESQKVFVKRDIAELLESGLRIINPVFVEKHIEINYKKSGNLNIEMSSDDLDRVLCNLLHNASKYSYPGPERFVKVRATEIGNKNKVEVSIESFGIPIKREEISTGDIWKFGYRGEMAYAKNRVGSGVGLADAKEVISVHNGNIEIESVPVGDDGDPPKYKTPYKTTVCIQLPRVQPPNAIR